MGGAVRRAVPAWGADGGVMEDWAPAFAGVTGERS